MLNTILYFSPVYSRSCFIGCCQSTALLDILYIWLFPAGLGLKLSFIFKAAHTHYSPIFFPSNLMPFPSQFPYILFLYFIFSLFLHVQFPYCRPLCSVPIHLSMLLIYSHAYYFLALKNKKYFVLQFFFVRYTQLRQPEILSLTTEQLIHNDSCELFLMNTSFTVIVCLHACVRDYMCYASGSPAYVLCPWLTLKKIKSPVHNH